MSPTTGVPLHFTVEAFGLGVAGVTLAWAALQRRWIAALGALMLGVGQVLYVGQFFAPDAAGSTVAGVLRAAGVVAIAAGALRGPGAQLLVPAVVLIAATSIWRIATQGGPASLAWTQRLPEFAGFVALAVWAWRRASSSVRTRIVAAFIGVLSAAVIVMGGASARVGVTNAIDDAQRRLDAAAQAERVRQSERSRDLLGRGALASALLSQLGEQSATAVVAQAFPDVARGFAWFMRPDGVAVGPATHIASVTTRSPSVRSALAGRPATSIAGGTDGAFLIAATTVYRAGSVHAATDVTGAIVVAEPIDRAVLERIAKAAGTGVDASVIAADGTTVATGGQRVPLAALGDNTTAGGQMKLGDARVLVSVVRLPVTTGGEAALALTLPLEALGDIPSSFPRALVGGVLVAALLAVVIALWLASRITRPIVQLADDAERVKTDFLATVSHELRTPLTPIRGYADLLRRGRVPRGRAEVYIDEIDEAARRLERIVSLLVEVAAIEAGRFVLDTQAVAPAELLDGVVQRWHGRSRRHELVVRVAKSLPRVAVDQASIATVLDELVDNALKFSPDGGPVELSARRSGDAVEFAVTDHGIGIAEEALDRLTDAFVQAEPGETRRFGGLGLGLTFARGALAANDSRIEVSSTKDGTTFSFVLPVAGMVSPMSDRAETST